jgi:hypothetical protein
MTRKRLLFFVVLGLIVILFAYVQKNRAQEDYLSQKESLLVFEKEAKELGSLKNKHKDKKISKRVLSNLKKIKEPSKDYKKSNSRVLEFSDINSKVLNRLIKKIQNSTLEIQKFDVIRESEEKAMLRLEIRK